MVEFIKNKEYKLYRQSGGIAVKTMRVTGINREKNKIRFEIGNQVFIENLKNNDKTEYISLSLTSKLKYYLNPHAIDIIELEGTTC